MLQFTITIQSISVVEANFLFPPLEQITIGSDGSISPSTVPIIQDGNVYTFTGNISNYVINVQLDNIIIDGAGYTLQKNRPAYGNQNGVSLTGRTNVTVRNIEIRGFVNGVSVSHSTGCNITENSFADNGCGIVLVDHATGNYVSGNNLTSSGILITNSTDNVLRDNTMDGEGPHFSVTYENVESAADFVNDVDASNIIEGKEVCYWVDQHNRDVPSTAGYVVLVNCSEIDVENVNVTNNGEGILLVSTTNSQIANNTLVGNSKGLVIYKSEENSFISNTIVNSTYGILAYSPKNSFKNNVLENNTYDINFEDRFIEKFDYSNIVDGTPICYWNWKNNMVVPENVGYVVVIGGSNLTIQNLNITNRRQGMLLVEVTDSVIINNIIVNTDEAIVMKGSSNNLIKTNLVENSSKALQLEASHSNKISVNKISYSSEVAVHTDDSSDGIFSGNYIDHNKEGLTINRGHNNVISENSILYCKSTAIHLGEANNNTVTGNNIAWSTSWAIRLTGSDGNNKIYHNDFINNQGLTYQVYIGGENSNSWDNGNEGNYWSDYQRMYPTAKTVEGSDLMDIPFVVNENNIDSYPLTKPVDITYKVTLLRPQNKTYYLNTLPLVFFATAPEVWMSYSLDNQQNVTTQGKAVLENLTEGTHKLTVYAGQNESGTCASETVYFTISETETEPEDDTTEQPESTDQEPTNTEQTENAQASLTITELLVIAATTAIITGTASFVVYQKRKNRAPVVD